jgi:hypothetical protein
LSKTKDITNIPAGQTRCSVCHVLKDNREFTFYKGRFTANGHRLMTNTNCICCQKVRSKERSEIKKKFKYIKPPEFGTSCECCKKPVYRNWQLDHCHDTGDFRGWLCKQCNTGLGNLGDNLDSLILAVEYLKRAKKNENPSQLDNLSRQRIFLENAP